MSEFKYTEEFSATIDVDGNWIIFYGNGRKIAKVGSDAREAMAIVSFCNNTMRPWMERISCDFRDVLDDKKNEYELRESVLRQLLEKSDEKIQELEKDCCAYKDEIYDLKHEININFVPANWHQSVIDAYEFKLNDLEQRLYYAEKRGQML